MFKVPALFGAFIFLIFCQPGFSQSASLDSIIKRYKKADTDTVKVNALNALFWHFSTNNSDSALKLATRALVLSEKINYLKGKLASCNNIGVIYFYKGNYALAMKFYLRESMLLEREKVAGEAVHENKSMLAATYNNIGNIYLKQKQYKMAENYFKKSVVINLLINDKMGVSHSYNNLGIIKEENNDYDEALKYYDLALKIKTETNDSAGIPSTLINMGVVAMKQKKYKIAIDYLANAHELAKRGNNKLDAALALINSGDVCYDQKEFNKAVLFYEKGNTICEKEKYLQYASYAFQSISMAYVKLKNTEKAFAYYQKYNDTKDTIYNRDNAKMLNELTTKYESENKEKEIKLLLSEKGIQELELNRNKILIYSFCGGLVLIAGFVVLVLYAYRQKRTANRELDSKNKKIEDAYALVSQKQHEILDSIHYAKRIQQSLLPSEKYMEKEIDRLTKGKN